MGPLEVVGKESLCYVRGTMNAQERVTELTQKMLRRN